MARWLAARVWKRKGSRTSLRRRYSNWDLCGGLNPPANERKNHEYFDWISNGGARVGGIVCHHTGADAEVVGAGCRRGIWRRRDRNRLRRGHNHCAGAHDDLLRVRAVGDNVNPGRIAFASRKGGRIADAALTDDDTDGARAAISISV